MKMTFDLLRSTSLPRAQRWHKQAIFTPGKPGYWNVAEWGNASAGEMGEAMGAFLMLINAGQHMGEACNAAKKLRRLDEGMQQADGDSPVPQYPEDSVEKVGKEIGDTIIYLDLFAATLGLRTEDCVAMAFNQISKREGFPERLPEYGVPYVSEAHENTWRLVDTDNHGGDYPNEKFIDAPCVNEAHARSIADAINDGYGEQSPRYIKVVRGTYTLQPGFAP